MPSTKKPGLYTQNETAEWDETFAKVLAETQPELYKVIRDAVAIGETPAKIEAFVKRKCPKNSIIPNMVRHAAEHERRTKSN